MLTAPASQTLGSIYGRVMRFAVAVAVVVGLGVVVGSSVVDDVVGTVVDVVGTVVDDAVGTVVDEVLAVEAADDDGPVDATTEVLGVACRVSEQPAEITAMAVNPRHTERNRTRADCPDGGSEAMALRGFVASRGLG